ncbi:antibiotic biosynthesis monooxygenase family protein [Streptomyces eurythermus]|uniref:antibiotic biosynthesis monooxygenase family protein n=1 Tax=Streptomyces eurythermus TaxID=42237 RepID=UPI0036A7FDAA
MNAIPEAGLRVVFHLRVPRESHAEFLGAYEKIRYQVAAIEGHIEDQVCQSLDDPEEWIITSEWETPEHFLNWEAGQEHRDIAGPMIGLSFDRRSLRYLVRRVTRHGEVV